MLEFLSPSHMHLPDVPLDENVFSASAVDLNRDTKRNVIINVTLYRLWGGLSNLYQRALLSTYNVALLNKINVLVMYSTCMFTCIYSPLKSPHTGAFLPLYSYVRTVFSYDTKIKIWFCKKSRTFISGWSMTGKLDGPNAESERSCELDSPAITKTIMVQHLGFRRNVHFGRFAFLRIKAQFSSRPSVFLPLDRPLWLSIEKVN